MFSQFGAQAFAQHVHGSLAGGVGGQFAIGGKGGGGRHVNNVAVAMAVDHLLGEQTRAVNDAPQVHFQQAIPFLDAGIQHPAGHTNAGVIDDDVRAADFFAHPIGQSLHGLGRAHVDFARPGNGAQLPRLGSSVCGAVFINIHTNQVRAFGSEAQRGGAADSGTGTGDHRRFSIQREGTAGGPHAGMLQGAAHGAFLYAADEFVDPVGNAFRVAEGHPVVGVDVAAVELICPEMQVLK